MTQQEIIERDVRITIGDLSLQLIMARARVQELEEQLAGRDLAAALAAKPNGKHPPRETPTA